MNTQERDQLTQLLKSLVDFKLSNKDSEAETLIKEAVNHQPDAAYLLVQRVMLMDHALQAAKAQIDDLQKRVQSGNASSSFLGSDPWAQPQPAANPGMVPGAGNYQTQPRFSQPAAPAQGGGMFGGGSSFLGNMATTAAGVVAGGFLFQGIESLLGHHGGMGGMGGFGGGFGQQPFGGEQLTENTVINNYYGDDAAQTANHSQYSDASYTPVSDDSYANNDFSADNADDSFFGGSDSSDSDWI